MPKKSINTNVDENLQQRILQHIQLLRILGLDESALDEHFVWAQKNKPSYTLLVERILGNAAAHKLERTVERRFKESGLKERKTLQVFDWAFQPKLNRAAIEELAELEFIKRPEDLIFTGKAGTGKSHILKAFILKGCSLGYYVRYSRCVDLVDDLRKGLCDGTYERRLKRWARAQFLVIDDVGLGQVKQSENEPTAAHMLYNLIDLRHGRVATGITSNIKLSAWGKYLGDTTITAAILDRLAMTSVRVEIDGPSYRQHVAEKRAKEKKRK